MTQLHLHDRNRTLDLLPDLVVGALVRCFGNHPAASDRDKAKAAETLTNLRDTQRWLACACREAGVDPPPLMSPRMRHGSVHIWRFGETPHARGCPFWTEPVVPGSPGEDEGPDGVSTPWGGSWLLLKRQATSVSDGNARESEGSHSPRRRSLPALARLLYTALTDVGYTTVAPDDIVTARGQPARTKAKNAYAPLDALKGKDVAPGIKLRDVGCTYLPGLPQLLRAMPAMESRFPKDQRAQGLFIGVVQEIRRVSPTETHLVWRGAGDKEAIAHVAGPVHLPGFAQSNTGPFWIIGQVAKPAGHDAYTMVRAYALRALSKSVLLPVDSGLERDTAEVLLSLATYWARPDALNVAVQIEKPLFPEIGLDGDACHPDFVVWIPGVNKRVLVETMGLDKDPAYLASKAITHPRMRALPGVVALVEHHPGDDTNELRKRLTAAVGKAMRTSH